VRLTIIVKVARQTPYGSGRWTSWQFEDRSQKWVPGAAEAAREGAKDVVRKNSDLEEPGTVELH
jgi:hypothetical protein